MFNLSCDRNEHHSASETEWVVNEWVINEQYSASETDQGYLGLLDSSDSSVMEIQVLSVQTLKFLQGHQLSGRVNGNSRVKASAV